MRMFNLRMAGALLAFGLAAFAGTACAQGPDFSDGLTGTGSNPALGGADTGRSADWRANQEAAQAAANAAMKAPAPASAAPGMLSPGDKLRVTIFGEEDLSGEFEIDNTGSLAMPLIGEVSAAGMSVRDLEKKIARVLEDGYLVSPRVNIEVLNFRPFFILGEVNKPGGYPYVNGLTVINAVALGGGYTTRAKTGRVKLIRANDSERKEVLVTEDTMVYPGDIIRVDERFF